MDENKKRFLHIVQQLRELIEQENIQPGDKLPSERVLTERLQVGRSSVREALRSLELLGLIMTKHGGGTYLADSQHHKLVDVVGSFILNNQSMKEIHTIRQIHEKEAIRAICSNKQYKLDSIWDSFFIRVELGEPIDRAEILKEIIILSENRLSLKMWLQLAAYCYADIKVQVSAEEKHALQTMLKAIQMNYYDEAIEAYDQWIQFFSPNDIFNL
jgi:GntR family transcriptional regulator, transcriptional repressor for pyruvate dehydrogenase complex